MRSPLPLPCVPDRPYKILLAQVGTLSFSHPSFGVTVLFIYLRLENMRDATSLRRSLAAAGKSRRCGSHSLGGYGADALYADCVLYATCLAKSGGGTHAQHT